MTIYNSIVKNYLFLWIYCLYFLSSCFSIDYLNRLKIKIIKIEYKNNNYIFNQIMDLKFLQELGTPISAEEMRELKKNEDEIKRLKNLDILLKGIYYKVINIAKTSTETLYKSRLLDFTSFLNEKFINDNRNEIIIGLQHLFKNCDIKLRKFSQANNVMCDITDLPEEALKCFNEKNHQTWIMIDWTESE
jgi:hypothetical protein